MNKKHLKNVGPIRHCEPPHALILHCHLPGVATVARRLRIDVHDDDDDRQKSVYHAKYLRISWTFFIGLVGVLVGMIIQIFILQSPKGLCYGNQLNLGDHRVEQPLLFASAFDNGLADRKSAFKMFNCNNRLHCFQIW